MHSNIFITFLIICCFCLTDEASVFTKYNNDLDSLCNVIKGQKSFFIVDTGFISCSSKSCPLTRRTPYRVDYCYICCYGDELAEVMANRNQTQPETGKQTNDNPKKNDDTAWAVTISVIVIAVVAIAGLLWWNRRSGRGHRHNIENARIEQNALDKNENVSMV